MNQEKNYSRRVDEAIQEKRGMRNKLRIREKELDEEIVALEALLDELIATEEDAIDLSKHRDELREKGGAIAEA